MYRERKILDEVSLIRTLAADATGADTPLRLGAFPTLGPYLLPRVLGGVRLTWSAFAIHRPAPSPAARAFLEVARACAGAPGSEP